MEEKIKDYGFELYSDELRNRVWYKKDDIDLVWYPNTQHMSIDVRTNFRVFDGRVTEEGDLDTLFRMVEIFKD